MTLTLTDTVIANISPPDSTDSANQNPLLLVTNFNGETIASYPTSFQLPTSYTLQVPVQSQPQPFIWYRGFQLLSSSGDPASFLFLSMKTKQLILRTGTPQNPGIILFQQPTVCSTDPLEDYRLILLPSGILLLGVRNFQGITFNTLWSTNIGINPGIFKGYEIRFFIAPPSSNSLTDSKLMSMSTNSSFQTSLVVVNPSPPQTFPLYTSNNPQNLPLGSISSLAATNNITLSSPLTLSYLLTLGSNIWTTLLTSTYFTYGSTTFPITALFGSSYSITQSNNISTYLPEIVLSNPISDSNIGTPIWKLSSYYNIYSFSTGSGSIPITKTFPSSPDTYVNLALTTNNSILVQIFESNSNSWTSIFQTQFQKQSPEYPGILVISPSSLNVYLSAESIWQSPVTRFGYNSPLSRENINANFTEIRLQTIFDPPSGYNISMNFLLSGEITVVNSAANTILYSNRLDRAFYSNFNINQLPPNSIFPFPAYRCFLTVSGNLVIRDQNQYVIWTSGTATHDLSVLDPSQAQLTFDGVRGTWNLSSQGTIYYQKPSVAYMAYSLSSPCSILVNPSNSFSLSCNLQTSLYSYTSPTYFPTQTSQFQATALQLALNGNLLLTSRTGMLFTTLPFNTIVFVITSNTPIWTSYDDGFYEYESSNPDFTPIFGQTSPPNNAPAPENSPGVTLYLTPEGYLQVWTGTFPESPNPQTQQLLFNLDRLPICGQSLLGKAPVEISVTTANLWFTYSNVTAQDSGFNGNLLCYSEALDTSQNQKLWQIPACLYSTGSCPSSCPPSFPDGYGIVFPLSNAEMNNLDINNHLKRVTTANEAKKFLSSNNGRYHAILETWESRVYLGVLDEKVNPNYQNGTTLAPSQFGGWYYTLPYPTDSKGSPVDSSIIGLYLTAKGNMYICAGDLIKHDSADAPILLFQTYTSDSSFGLYAISSDGFGRLPFHLILRNSGRLQIINNNGNLIWSSASAKINGEAPNPQLSSINSPPRISYTFHMLNLDGTFNQNSSQQAYNTSQVTWQNNFSYKPGLFLWSPDGRWCMSSEYNTSMTMNANLSPIYPWRSNYFPLPTGQQDLTIYQNYFELIPNIPYTPYAFGCYSASTNSSGTPTQYWYVILNDAPIISNYAPFTLSIYESNGFPFLQVENTINVPVALIPKVPPIQSFWCDKPAVGVTVIDPFIRENLVSGGVFTNPTFCNS